MYLNLIRLCFSFSLFLNFFLGANDKIPYLTSECDVLALVEGVVNAYNGKLIQIDQDIYIDGSDPLEMTRYYDSGHHFDSEFGYGVGCSYPALLTFFSSGDHNYAKVELRMGLEVLCDLKKDKTKKEDIYWGTISKDYLKNGYTNCCEALIRGEPSVYAMEVEIDNKHGKAFVTLGDGTKRHYIYHTTTSHGNVFVLTLEERPNNTLRRFYYQHVHEGKNAPIFLERIETQSQDSKIIFNWLNFSDSYPFTVTGSNGEWAKYYLMNTRGKVSRIEDRTLYHNRRTNIHEEPLLIQASANNSTPACYEYMNGTHSRHTLFSMVRAQTANNKSFEVLYDHNLRVKELYNSVISKIPLYTFDYHSNYTVIKDARGSKKRYEFTKRRLAKLIEDHKIQQYAWDDKGQLTAHTIFNNSENQLLKREYKYDPKGNILEVKLKGCLTAEGVKDIFTVSYSYSNDRNLLLNENRNDLLRYRYTYYPNTNLITSKRTFDADKCVEREFFQYDKNGILITTVMDDGSEKEVDNFSNVTYRKIIEIIPQLDFEKYGMTLPAVIKEEYVDPKTAQKHLLKTVKRTYTTGNRIAQEEVYDALNAHQYTLFFDYNDRLELIRETDALGHETIYEYDDTGNKIFEKKITSGKEIHFYYDEVGQLIKEQEKHSDIALTKTYKYDAMGNRISSKDIYGQKTTYEYDLAGREISVTNPQGHTESKIYDAFGNITQSIDKEGYTTKTTYNILGKSLKVFHPDGTYQKYVYNLQGDLIQEWFRDGTYVINETDYSGRVTMAKTYASDGTYLKTCSYRYKGLNLISEIDALGNIIHYRYDGAGRKIAKIEGEIETHYSYDSLGNLTHTSCGNRVQIKQFDFLGQVIEERVESLLGDIFSKSQYAYDSEGNRILQRIYRDSDNFSETSTIYNSQNLPILEKDALGQETHIRYKQTTHLKTRVKDPSGRQTLEIFDSLNRLRERKIFSGSGILIAHTSFSYDKRGNQILQEEQILQEGLYKGHHSVAAVYNSMGQKVLETEQGLRTTQWAYKAGRLHNMTLPDGVVLIHSYDSLGRLSNQNSSDGSIHYQFTYDLNDNLIGAHDLVQNSEVLRSYDRHGRFIHEKQVAGFTCEYSYDELDRLVEMKFADESITYTYSPTTLTSSSRFKKGELLYSYHQNCDWIGKMIEANLPHQIPVEYAWDGLGRCKEIKTATFQQKFNYDQIGNLVNTQVNDLLGAYEADYTYDPLKQLTSETGQFSNKFENDSINNRISYNGIFLKLDDLNQLLQNEKDHYRYDANGRRLSKNDASNSYDALGRLVNFSHNKQTTLYTYDPLGRRIRQSSPDFTKEYFYQFDTEMGSTSSQQKEFRLLHHQATLAIELDGQVYAPIRNHRGDICQLLSPRESTTIRYDAFGNFMHQGLLPPWLFSGQRYDATTQLYHFHKRDFDPSIGRWITPDPLHFADGPNLYAYVHNNPLTFVDPYGLWTEEARNCIHAFSRGALDDATWNASTLALGEFKPSTIYEKWAYYGGTGGSVVAGFFLRRYAG